MNKLRNLGVGIGFIWFKHGRLHVYKYYTANLVKAFKMFMADLKDNRFITVED